MTSSVAILLLCVVLYVIACDVLRARRMHELMTRLRRERNRNRFGELRTQLIRLAVDGEINPKSNFFQSIYMGTTSLMRNPYAFQAAAQAILMIPAPEQQVRTSRPTRAEGALALDLARRIDLLCRDYSRLYVAAAWFLDRMKLPDHMPPLWVQMMAARGDHHRMSAMIEARKRLEATAQLAAA